MDSAHRGGNLTLNAKDPLSLHLQIPKGVPSSPLWPWSRNIDIGGAGGERNRERGTELPWIKQETTKVLAGTSSTELGKRGGKN